MSNRDDCELCEAVPFTEWYYDDDECWIAECESCSVPMVVWRVHDPHPPDDVRERLWARLDEVAGRLAAERAARRRDSPERGGRERDGGDVPAPDPMGQGERPRSHYIDDRLRTIPDHYHAHARPRGGVFGTAGGRR